MQCTPYLEGDTDTGPLWQYLPSSAPSSDHQLTQKEIQWRLCLFFLLSDIFVLFFVVYVSETNWSHRCIGIRSISRNRYRFVAIITYVNEPHGFLDEFT